MTFSKTVKYIHKVVSAPKKIYCKFNSFSTIHVFKFAFACLFSNHTAFKTHEMQHAPGHPLRLAPAALVWSAPPRWMAPSRKKKQTNPPTALEHLT